MQLRAAMRFAVPMVALTVAACGEPVAPGSTLEGEMETSHGHAPARAFDRALDGIHVERDDPTTRLEAHHYCTSVSDELTQCAIFDGDDARANLIGIEYVISASLFDALSPEEKSSWHPHDELKTYGKTWHIWDVGHHQHLGDQPPRSLKTPRSPWPSKASRRRAAP